MKIPLRMGQEGATSNRATQAKDLERDVRAARKGDWNAKNSLARTFMPLLTSLAQKRSSDTAEVNRRIEAGKEGLFTAVQKYKDSIGGERFQMFALGFIEAAMDRKAKKPGFFARLFGQS